MFILMGMYRETLSTKLVKECAQELGWGTRPSELLMLVRGSFGTAILWYVIDTLNNSHICTSWDIVILTVKHYPIWLKFLHSLWSYLRIPLEIPCIDTTNVYISKLDIMLLQFFSFTYMLSFCMKSSVTWFSFFSFIATVVGNLPRDTCSTGSYLFSYSYLFCQQCFSCNHPSCGEEGKQ